ncbi:trace amine-associated receptor 1 isoform X1 [Periplaneta americana]|uniref:trace amine-associated receptor 1 isoform X1 n=3 Tax=Periplaneta americana TaxID=6978 RepID=UPI0037E82946
MRGVCGGMLLLQAQLVICWQAAARWRCTRRVQHRAMRRVFDGMDAKSPWLTPPPLHNSSCAHPRFLAPPAVGAWELAQALFILLLSVGILGANLLVILVLNSRRYARYIHSQPRYLLTSLASNDLAIGLFVTPFGFLPALYHCWPYGEIFCQIQSLLRGALSQQSAVILICMAMDRYMCMLHPVRYHKHSSKKGCVAVISLTWVTSVTLFAVMVLPRGGYYFNPTGLLACDPFFSRPSLRILASCLFYFPTTMILMYCYGSAFHVNKLRLKRVVCADDANMEKLVAYERRLSTSASRTMAAISLGFIVMVTPWTIQEVVAACTGTKVPPFIDFVVTWLALSNSFWNPFLYWLLNNHFRRISKELLLSKVPCRRRQEALGAKARCCSVTTAAAPPAPAARTDLEGLSEKYWGEILERTVSSNSLQRLQRVYGHRATPPPPPPPPPALGPLDMC